jgi:hypothetical protein
VKSETSINPIMPKLLPQIFTNSNKTIDLKDSEDSSEENPTFEKCEKIIINLALDDIKSVIVTQNEEFVRRVKNIHETHIIIINPIQALDLALSD